MRLFCRDIIDKTENDWTVEQIFQRAGTILYSDNDDLFFFKETGTTKYLIEDENCMMYAWYNSDVTVYGTSPYIYTKDETPVTPCIGYYLNNGNWVQGDIISSYDSTNNTITAKIGREGTIFSRYSGADRPIYFYNLPYYFSYSSTDTVLDSTALYKSEGGCIMGRAVDTSTTPSSNFFVDDIRDNSYVEIPTRMLNSSIFDFTFGNGYFAFLGCVKYGMSPVRYRLRVLYSSDLVNYSYYTSDIKYSPDSSEVPCRKIEYINGKFIAFDSHFYDNTAVFYSANLTDWNVILLNKNIKKIEYNSIIDKYIFYTNTARNNPEIFITPDIFDGTTTEYTFDKHSSQISDSYTINGMCQIGNELLLYGGYNNHPFILESRDNGKSWKKPIVSSISGAWTSCAYSKGRDTNVVMLASTGNTGIAWKEI